MTDQIPSDETPAGIDRRTMLKRGAIVGGALVWTTPVVQSIASPAFAQTSPGPGPQGCIATVVRGFKIDEGTNEFDALNGNQCLPTDGSTSLEVGGSVLATSLSLDEESGLGTFCFTLAKDAVLVDVCAVGGQPTDPGSTREDLEPTLQSTDTDPVTGATTYCYTVAGPLSNASVVYKECPPAA